MGLFYNRFLAGLNEAEVDGQQIGEENSLEDYTATNDNNEQENQPIPQDNRGQDTQNNPSTEEPPPEDYTTSEYTEIPSDGGTTQDNGGTPNSNSEPESEVDEIKKQEEELYNELTPEQLDIKHKELKNLYLKMYDTVVSIIDRLGDINASEDNIGIMEYVSNNLANLKEMISDYVNDVYKTKSYIENSINYNRFLAVLNGVNKILEEMNSKNIKN